MVNSTLPVEPVWRCVDSTGVLLVEARPKLRLSSLVMVRDAVREGAGIAQLPLSLAYEDLQAGRLINWGSMPDRPVELSVLHHSRRLASLKIAAFIEFICEAFPNRALVG